MKAVLAIPEKRPTSYTFNIILSLLQLLTCKKSLEDFNFEQNVREDRVNSQNCATGLKN